MRSDYDRSGDELATGRSWLRILLIPLIAFLAGLAAMGWLLANWQTAATFLGVTPAAVPAGADGPLPAVTVQPEPAAAPATHPDEPQRLLIDPEMIRRVGQLELNLAEVQNQSRAAAGNADRAEGLLVAFAARRALDRGVSLGYLEGLLRERFGQSQRQAVATIITAARQPVTLEELQLGLQEVGPQLIGGGPDQSWWSAFRTELADLITIRKADTPSTLPAERLRRATRRLEAEQVDVALAEVLRMPSRDNAAEWIAAARRYVSARRALDTIETAALLDPRNPPQVAPRAVPPNPIQPPTP